MDTSKAGRIYTGQSFDVILLQPFLKFQGRNLFLISGLEVLSIFIDISPEVQFVKLAINFCDDWLTYRVIQITGCDYVTSSRAVPLCIMNFELQNSSIDMRLRMMMFFCINSALFNCLEGDILKYISEATVNLGPMLTIEEIDLV